MSSKKKFIPYGRQSIDSDDINSVIDTLKSDFLTQGPKLKNLKMQFLAIVEPSIQWLFQMQLQHFILQPLLY